MGYIRSILLQNLDPSSSSYRWSEKALTHTGETMSPKCLALLGTVILSLSFPSTKALRCLIRHAKDQPDETPICCPSGWVTPGACTHLMCASGEGEDCNDEWQMKPCAPNLKCKYEEKERYNFDKGKCVPKKGKDEREEFQTKVPKCKSEHERFQCRCAKDHKSKCVPVTEKKKGWGTRSKFGWCFLENVYDASNPEKYCYGDVMYSRRFGKFFSYQACDSKQKPSDKDPLKAKEAQKKLQEIVDMWIVQEKKIYSRSTSSIRKCYYKCMSCDSVSVTLLTFSSKGACLRFWYQSIKIWRFWKWKSLTSKGLRNMSGLMPFGRKIGNFNKKNCNVFCAISSFG